MQVSLNFLSPQKKAVLRMGFIFAYVQNMLFILFVVIVFCSGLLLALRLMLNETLQTIDQQTLGSTKDADAVTAEITAVNAYLTRHEMYMKGFAWWSSTISEITDSVPAGVQITQLSINPQGNVSIRGKALNRASVLALESTLKANKNFKDVVSPLSNILSQFNVDFEFSMNLVAPPVPPPAPVAEVKRVRRPTTTEE